MSVEPAPLVEQPKSGQVVIITQGGDVPPPPYQAAPQDIREFQTGICECKTEGPFCAWTTFCFCCAACNVAQRLDENCCVTCCLHTAGIIALRTKLRTQYGIAGNVCEDCLIVTFCPQCAICQMDREMKQIGI